MADTVSAATIVGAVLEQAGYLTQSSVLDYFENFFLSAGHLIYLIGIFGALLSFAVFGSFRAARYLLLGPIIYWFLIVPRSEIDGVTWSVAGVDKVINETSGKEIVDKVTKQEDPPKIATVFYLYTKFIDNMVRESVRVILSQNENKDLFFVDRASALETIVRSRMSDPKLIDMYENLLWGVSESSPGIVGPCAELMYYAVGGMSAAENSVKLENLNNNLQLEIIATSVKGDVSSRIENLKRGREKFTELYKQTEGATYVRPNASMREFLTENKDHPTLAPIYQKGVVNNQPVLCREVWDTVAVGARMEAERIWSEVSRDYKDKWKQSDLSESEVAELEKDFCQEISAKMGGGGSEDESCDIVPLVFMYIMRNSTSPDYLSRIINKHKNQMKFTTPTKGHGYQAKGVDSTASWEAVLGSDGDVLTRYIKSGQEIDQNTYEQLTDKSGVERLMYFKNTDTEQGEGKWLSYSELHHVDGQFDNVFNQYLKYDMERIRNTVFSFALELPYWQGTILYLLAYVYPFWALLVLLPGRAQNFILLPLLWLWAKSWDIGFALSMIFEQVLWNLLPHQAQLNENPNDGLLAERAPQDIDNLMAFYAEGFNMDPSYNLHTYYWALSIVVLAIPNITGAAILKGKRSILASFEEGAHGMSTLVGQRARSAFGMQQLNSHLVGARHTSGMARLGVSRGGGSFLSLLGEGRLSAGLGHGAIAAGGGMLKNNPSIFGAGAALGVGTAVAANGMASNDGETPGGSAFPAPNGVGGVNGAAASNGDSARSDKNMSEALALGAMALPAAMHQFSEVRTAPEDMVFAKNQSFQAKDGILFVQQGLAQTMKLVTQSAKTDASLKEVFDELQGRYGQRWRDFDAVAASLDGGGGFEMNETQMNSVGDIGSMFRTQMDTLFGALENSAHGVANISRLATGGDKNLLESVPSSFPAFFVGSMLIYQGATLNPDGMGYGDYANSENIFGDGPLWNTNYESRNVGNYTYSENYVQSVEGAIANRQPKTEDFSFMERMFSYSEPVDGAALLPFASTFDYEKRTGVAGNFGEEELVGVAALKVVEGMGVDPSVISMAVMENLDSEKINEWYQAHGGLDGLGAAASEKFNQLKEGVGALSGTAKSGSSGEGGG